MTPPPAPSFWHTGHRGTLFSAFLYTEVSFLVWIILGPLSIYIAKENALNAAQVGFLVALPILAGTLLRLPVGLLVDRFGPNKDGDTRTIPHADGLSRTC